MLAVSTNPSESGMEPDHRTEHAESHPTETHKQQPPPTPSNVPRHIEPILTLYPTLDNTQPLAWCGVGLFAQAPKTWGFSEKCNGNPWSDDASFGNSIWMPGFRTASLRKGESLLFSSNHERYLQTSLESTDLYLWVSLSQLHPEFHPNLNERHQYLWSITGNIGAFLTLQCQTNTYILCMYLDKRNFFSHYSYNPFTTPRCMSANKTT